MSPDQQSAPPSAPPGRSWVRSLLHSPQLGLLGVLLALGVVLTLMAGSHADPLTHQRVNNFLNKYTLLQMATDASGFAIMGVGATIVIIAGGIDLSVGAIYALSGVTMAMVLRAAGPMGTASTVLLGLGTCIAVSLLCGLANGVMVIGLGEGLYPVPMLVMFVVTALGAVYLSRTVMGRHVFAVGGNPEASRYAGLNVKRVTLGVFVLSGLSAGIAAFLGAGFYGSSTSSDANGYELYVIASAVVGGASLAGGKGSAVSAMLGAMLIVVIRQAIRTLHLDQNYEWIIVGTAMILAVVIDQSGTKLLSRRLAAGRAESRST